MPAAIASRRNTTARGLRPPFFFSSTADTFLDLELLGALGSAYRRVVVVV